MNRWYTGVWVSKNTTYIYIHIYIHEELILQLVRYIEEERHKIYDKSIFIRQAF